MRRTTRDNCNHAGDDEDINDDVQDKHIPQFTMTELSIAIDSVEKGKSEGNKGIKAEDLTKKRQT